MKIPIYDVLKAASTKWNFLNFYPGFVGGHCVAVDPYYLAYISKVFGYKPKLLLNARKINDHFYSHVVNILKKNHKNKNKILLAGITFKENCPDIRNSQVLKLFKSLKKNFYVEAFDPIAKDSDIKLTSDLKKKYFDAVVICVSHKKFIKLGPNYFKKLVNTNGKVYDLKNCFKNQKDFIKL